MRVKTRLLMLTLLAGGVQADQIYQCGNSFQDTPCINGSKPKVVATYEREQSTGASEDDNAKRLKEMQEQTLRDADERYKSEVEAAKRAAEATQKDRVISDAIKSHKVIEGLSKADVIKSWGDPDRKKEVTTKYGFREEWTYVKDWGNKDYVYFEGDKVSEVSLTDTHID